ncbi:hypothetical protein GCM10011375_31140 [Hymenobacter qilianensis]|uniref:Uncharacterized protein n=2 Tax=Hymenobacter qilianensis TaxID=1385715 RepID=A0ACB5PUU0_9BACT|nr:hypothetical protein [Hymenobacter qilianensis]QNP51580.1 hypothetical protein H9L05_16525 [Hymenobacter qilianensis]GGF73793.1 hypothetical protein GCM10011375_31140 [Hymenobacter qilianensis]
MAAKEPNPPSAPAFPEWLPNPISVLGSVLARKTALAFRLSLLLTASMLLLACEEDTRIPGFPSPPLVVTEATPHGWTYETMGVPATTTVKFSPGPATPILGTGSVRFTTTATHNHSFNFSRVRNTQYAGTLLSSITELSYATFVERRDTLVDTPFFVLHADNNGDGTADDILNFTPWYQTAQFIVPAGISVPEQWVSRNNTWQTWDVLHGGFFIVTDVLSDPDNNGRLITLASYIQKYPHATIRNVGNGRGGIRVGLGGPTFANNFIGYVDNVKIGIAGQTTTYDFEN